MTDSTKKEGRRGTKIGDFEVSSSAVEHSKIGGLEDVAELAGTHWKSVSVVLVLFFIVTSYQGRIQILEKQVQSLSSVYSALPEDKALAMGALKSVEDLRGAMTVVIEERVLDLLERPGLLRRGSQVKRRVIELKALANGLGKLWTSADLPAPPIYPLVDEIAKIVIEGEWGGGEGLSRIHRDDSGVAFGVSRYLMAWQRAEASRAGNDITPGLVLMREAKAALPPSGVVESDSLRLQLAAGDHALLSGNRPAFLEAYRQGWSQWMRLFEREDSVLHVFRVSRGLAQAFVFPVHALSMGDPNHPEAMALKVSELEGALGAPFNRIMESAVSMAWKAKELNVDRLAALVTASKLDLVLAGFFANDALARSLREDAWRTYQKTTGQFQGVALPLAPSALVNGASASLREAQSLAVAHGEELELRDWAISDRVLLDLPQEECNVLGIKAVGQTDQQ